MLSITPPAALAAHRIRISSMLRIHVMQVIYNLSDPAMEDALYEIESMRRFAGIRLSRVPDETTTLNFRHLLEQHNLGKKLFKKINRQLARFGKAASLMQRLSKRRVRRKTKKRLEIRRCTRPRKAINGTLA